MNVTMKIVDGEERYIADCTEILQNSELGKAYFSDRKKAAAMLEYALGEKELFVALDEQNECVGQLPDFYKKGIDCYLMMKRR